MNRYTLLVILLAIVVAGLLYVDERNIEESQQTLLTQQEEKQPEAIRQDAVTNATTTEQAAYKNATYIVNGSSVTLHNGYAESEVAPGSASKVITHYFGNEVTGDFNGDGMDDIAFLITQDGGGSGTFYYVVAALKTADGYRGTNAVLLGDRIAPQTTEFRNREIIVNYADRVPGEPFSVSPSVGVSKYLKVTSGMLSEVQN